MGGLDPSFSPDGSKIVYWTGSQIALMNAGGTSPANLTTSGYGGDPFFSPDGTKIAYADFTGIWRIDADGTGKVSLFTPTGRTAVSPNWSPDGSKIAFASDRDSAFPEINEIFVMNANGTDVQRLTTQDPDRYLSHTSPAFSPDGMRIVFSRGAGGLVVMNADGSGQTTLATTAVSTAGTDWQPIPAAASADLSLTKTDSPDPVTAGQNLTYTLTAGNAGPDTAASVTVTDTLPGGVNFVSASASQGSCSGTSTVTCALGTLANGGSATITIVVTATTAGTLTNTASIASPTADPTAGNNSTSATTTVNAAPPAAAADLALTKADSPDPVTAGENLTYTLGASNAGPDAAAAVTVTDTLPAGVSFVSASASQGSCSGTSTVTCALGSLASGATATVTIVVRPTAAGTLTNTASIASPTADPTPGNNSASSSTTAGAAAPPTPQPPSADLSLTMSAPPEPVALDSYVTFEIVVVNNGPSEATGVVLTNAAPASLAAVRASYVRTVTGGQSTYGCVISDGQVRCSIGAMASGLSISAAVVFKTTTNGTAANSASVGANETDAEPSNDTARAAVDVRPFSMIDVSSEYPDPAELRYRAIDGERNDISIEAANGRVVITDNGAELRLGASVGYAGYYCVLLSRHQARCEIRPGRQLRVDTGDRDDRINVTSWSGSSGGSIVLDGGDGDDLIGGGAKPEILRGGRGADVLDGGGGDDSLFGGPGRDVLLGGAGDESLSTGSGPDLVSGGAGHDAVRYDDRTKRVIVDIDNVADDGEAAEKDNIREDVERIVGGDGDDFLTAGSTGATLEGGAGDDLLVGAAGADTLLGGTGFDRLEGGGGADWLEGGADDDVIAGGPGSDRAEGTSGSDRLDGGAGDDHLFGDSTEPADTSNKTDRLNGDEGNDTLVGGNTARDVGYAAHRNILRGGAGNDRIVGAAGYLGKSFNELDGGAGNDVLTNGTQPLGELHGGPGNDTLSAATGAADGGRGIDTFSLPVSGCLYSPNETPDAGRVVIDLGGGHNGSGFTECRGFSTVYRVALKDFENIRGSDHAETLRGSIGVNVIEGNGGDDVIVGRHNDDRLLGGAGADTIHGDQGGDEIVGGQGADHVAAGAGPDLIEARDGTADSIDCGGGEDRVFRDAADALSGCELVNALALLLLSRP